MKLEMAKQIESDDPQSDMLTVIEDLGIDEGILLLNSLSSVVQFASLVSFVSL